MAISQVQKAQAVDDEDMNQTVYLYSFAHILNLYLFLNGLHCISVITELNFC